MESWQLSSSPFLTSIRGRTSSPIPRVEVRATRFGNRRHSPATAETTGCGVPFVVPPIGSRDVPLGLSGLISDASNISSSCSISSIMRSMSIRHKYLTERREGQFGGKSGCLGSQIYARANTDFRFMYGIHYSLRHGAYSITTVRHVWLQNIPTAADFFCT